MRVAAIDVGSNALRFIAAERSPIGPAILEKSRAAVRLGHEAFRTGLLLPAAIDEAIASLRGFRARIDALEIRRYRAVATSAVRESRNGADLIRRARTEARIELEPITAGEEIRLAWLAMRERVDLGERPWLLADLGGGSLELSLIDCEHVHWSASHPLGAVRLLEELTPADRDPERLRARIADSMTALDRPPASEIAGFIATGGNIEALAELAGAKVDRHGVARLSRKRLGRLIERLAGMSVRRRITELGLRPDRADVILPAAVVYEHLCRATGAVRIIVPNVGVKEGILVELGAAVTGSLPSGDRPGTAGPED